MSNVCFIIFILTSQLFQNFENSIDFERIQECLDVSQKFTWETCYFTAVVTVTPGEAFSGNVLNNTIIFNRDVGSNQSISTDEEMDRALAERYFQFKCIETVMMDNRLDREWIRIDRVEVPKSQTIELSEVNHLLMKGYVSLKGSRGACIYDYVNRSGSIEPRLNPYPIHIWEWTDFPQRNFDGEYLTENFYKRFYNIENDIENGRIAFRSKEKRSDYVLKKDWDYAPAMKVLRKKGLETYRVDVYERTRLESGYWFPMKIKRIFYGQNEYAGKIDQTVEVEVLDVQEQMDLPESAFEFPFERGAYLTDARSANYPEVTWEADENYLYPAAIPLDGFKKIDAPIPSDVNEEHVLVGGKSVNSATQQVDGVSVTREENVDTKSLKSDKVEIPPIVVPKHTAVLYIFGFAIVIIVLFTIWIIVLWSKKR